MTDEPMTRGDRNELLRIVRMRSRDQKADTEARKAELLADFEVQMDTRYAADDERWADFVAAANEAADLAQEQVAKVCADLGIPEKFRPKMGLWWSSRGENATADRRAELRRLAVTALDAAAKRAKADIAKAETAASTELMAGGLETDAAREWLGRLPTAARLMPPLNVKEIEALAPKRERW